jgi:hypothetical protein
MAPDRYPVLAIWDLSLSTGSPVGPLSYYEATGVNERLTIRWAATRKPAGFLIVNKGVAYVRDDGNINPTPASVMSPESLGSGRYRWHEGGFRPGAAEIMMVLVLPEGHTVDSPSTPPVGAKIFKERLALYWIPTAGHDGQVVVDWTMQTFDGEPSREVERLRRLSTMPPGSSPIVLESAAARSGFLAPFFGGLTLLFFMALVMMAAMGLEIPCNSRFLVIAILAFGAALSSSFLGGTAAAKGAVPIPYLRSHPLQFRVAGGIAVFVIVLLVSYYAYVAVGC